MTGRALRTRLWLVALGVGVCLLLSGFEYFSEAHTGPTFISSNATLLALIFAGYMAYIFQQRSKAIDDLRRWWSEIVLAKSEIFAYCDKENPTEDDYLKAFYKLSTAMDTLRLIYCNVGITKTNRRGYYPFEQVRDLVDIARSIAPKRKVSANERISAKIAINEIFQSLRHAIQDEAKSAPPDYPTLYDSEHRSKYKRGVLKLSGIDIEKIREENKIL